MGYQSLAFYKCSILKYHYLCHYLKFFHIFIKCYFILNKDYYFLLYPHNHLLIINYFHLNQSIIFHLNQYYIFFN